MTHVPPHTGYLPDLPDERDHLLGAGEAPLRARPPRTHNVDRVKRWHPQGAQNGCVGAAGVTLIEQARAAAGLPDVPLSLQHLYGNARLLGGLGLGDVGSRPRDALRAAQKLGVAPEAMWRTSALRADERPPAEVEMAGIVTPIEYRRVAGVGEYLRERLLDALLDGPVLIGQQIGPHYLQHRGEGVLGLPPDDERADSGHATVVLDYLDGGRTLLVLGSWPGWGYERVTPYGTTLECLGLLSSDWITHPTMGDAWAVRVLDETGGAHG